MLDFMTVTATLVVGIIILVILVNWVVHLAMALDDNKPRGWASYRKFKEEFEKVDGWFHQEEYRDSLFSGNYSIEKRSRTDEIFAQMITFNYKNMLIIDPISYLMVQLYVKNYIIKNGLRNPSVKDTKVEKWR